MVLEILLVMLERLGIIVSVAFLMTRFKFVRHLIDKRKLTKRQQLSVIIMFGIFGIIGTFTGITVNTELGTYSRWVLEIGEDEAIANSRVIGVVVAGLLGGWKLGLGAGVIAGVHRYSLGGFTGFACGLSTVIAGLIAGFFYRKNKNNRIISLQTSLFVGALAEAVQMGIILLISRPFDQSLLLVQNIGLPMIIANGIGTAIFILIIRNVINEEEKIGSLQAQKALKLADLTLKYLRKGLTEESALPTCQILLKEVNADAVSVTNKEKVLAYVGVGEEKHLKTGEIKTIATKRVLKEGKLVIAGLEEIRCEEEKCTLNAAIIAPLKIKEETIGTLKFYFKSEKNVSPMIIELSKGLSTLLSHQLELSEVDRHLELAKQAEIKVLQAQVSPHFLFNTLNTIVSLIRTDPMKARKLLISLSHYFRQNLSGTSVTETSLEEEIKHVRSYLEIEEARFSDKLTVRYDIDEEALSLKLPPMTLQPIVENAMKHGLKNLQADHLILIKVNKETEGIYIIISDNGIGISEERLKVIGKERVESKIGTGIGLYNVLRRMQMMYGDQIEFSIQSKNKEGTTISFYIPTQKPKGRTWG